MKVPVTRTYLELLTPDQFRPADVSGAPPAEFVRRDDCTPAEYRQTYATVGRRWNWRDRLTWSDERITALLNDPTISVWNLRVDGELAGFVELVRLPDGSVEIGYFGLVEAFFGRRLGALMLQRAVEEAWKLGANRVWLHTCTLDSAQALPNYLARGFTKFHEERYEYELA